MTASEYIDYISRLYQKSSIPVFIFTEDMKIIWHNNIFRGYFPSERMKKETVSALFKTAIGEKLFKAPGFSAKFEVTISSVGRTSSDVNLLVFPAETKSEKPRLFSAYLDDLTDERRMTLRKTYLGLLEASKLKDDDTGNHIKRVGAYAKRMSEELYLLGNHPEVDFDFIENIHFLAPMHDVGKIGTPDEILTKRGPLNEAEWKIMKEHTINGALILSNYPDPMAMEIARAHHEKWNGSGYLFGLAGEDIPLSARITAIADVYDALRMKRSYKEAFSHQKAIDIITGDSGTHFDPTLVKVFLSISDAFESIYSALADGQSPETEDTIEELPIYSNDELLSDTPEELEEIEELEELE